MPFVLYPCRLKCPQLQRIQHNNRFYILFNWLLVKNVYQHEKGDRNQPNNLLLWKLMAIFYENEKDGISSSIGGFIHIVVYGGAGRNMQWIWNSIVVNSFSVLYFRTPANLNSAHLFVLLTNTKLKNYLKWKYIAGKIYGDPHKTDFDTQSRTWKN